MKILLVDDFELMRTLMKKALTEIGFTDVHEAPLARLASEMIDAALVAGKPYNLVFCDIIMPGFSGVDLLKAVREDVKLKNLKFIMVSAEQESIVEALRYGADDYILKPVSKDELRKKMERIVTGKNSV
jgi:two-component system, chemotaxis family, chemotaxis protein CheY